MPEFSPRHQCAVLRPGLLRQAVNFRREDEVALRQPINFVSVSSDAHLAPLQDDIRVVALFFRQLSHPVDEFQRLAEVGEFVGAGKVVFVDHGPAGQLLFERLQLRAFERRHTAAARHTGFAGKIGNRCISHRRKPPAN